MFSETEERNLKDITELYGKVKELIIFCEENQEEFKINKEVSDFSPSAIQAVIPNYYSEIRPSVESITTDIIKLRNNKDIAQPSPELFNEYFRNVIKLQEMFKVIVIAKPSLIEYANKERKGKWSDVSLQIIVGIIIGAILVWVGLSG
ncbi:MAG: hypothetical protein WC556_10145 [Candidatus Methanoperedens sp.]